MESWWTQLARWALCSLILLAALTQGQNSTLSATPETQLIFEDCDDGHSRGPANAFEIVLIDAVDLTQAEIEILLANLTTQLEIYCTRKTMECDIAPVSSVSGDGRTDLIVQYNCSEDAATVILGLVFIYQDDVITAYSSIMAINNINITGFRFYGRAATVQPTNATVSQPGLTNGQIIGIAVGFGIFLIMIGTLTIVLVILTILSKKAAKVGAESSVKVPTKKRPDSMILHSHSSGKDTLAVADT